MRHHVIIFTIAAEEATAHPDDMMMSAFADTQFEDIEDGLEEEMHEADVNRNPEFTTEEDLPGAGLPDWAQDLIEDKNEHGFEEITDEAQDPIAQEEEALERVLKATEERTHATPELDRANPLSQLRSEAEESHVVEKYLTLSSVGTV